MSLYTLPAEIHLEIFSYLHSVYSTCLGLTCKKFYPIHRAMNGKVRLAQPHPLEFLNTLPIYIQFDILSYLQPEFSTGLRRTSKKFYNIGHCLNGTIPFISMAEWAGEEHVPDQFWHLLHNWMGPEWFWSSWEKRFTTEKEFRGEEKGRELLSYRYRPFLASKAKPRNP